MDYKQYIEKMNSFKQIDWVHNHLQLSAKPNFWSILEYGEGTHRSAHEIRTSRMIRWLMDPNETHYVGNLFAQKLISLLGGSYQYHGSKNKNIQATAEYENIDVFYRDLSQHVCVAIEVKQYAQESKTSDNQSQLNKYEKIVKAWLKVTDENIQPYYIFLTPLKTAPTNKNWRAVGYADFISLINELINDLAQINPPYKEDTVKIVTDFKEDLQRTLDFLQKDHQQINEKLSEDEKKLTLKLAYGETVQELEQALQLNRVEREAFYDVVLLVQNYLYAQNHAPNKQIGLLVRKIYNYLAEHQQIDTTLLNEPIAKDTLTSINPALVQKYNLAFTHVKLTSGKGQGLFLYSEQKEQRIYLSGDTYGNFPNDGIQLLPWATGKPESIVRSRLVKRNDFIVDELINENKVKDRHGKLVVFDDLMEQHVMKAIQELNKH